MYVDIWSAVARRQMKVDTIETLWKTKLIKRGTRLTLLVAYYKVSNATLKQLMKAQVQVTALLRRIRK
jgi:hypothetical protein